ncbi:DUF4357 domain-containing protein [Deinococcus sp.]|uniref:DUF4357 domain-containing protein n=1 Tax=Deinococcus sp. TaxID=47478 RepID=UPI00286992C8|nr:DUF4357 domain-containing protein [Deinococcus sp.]
MPSAQDIIREAVTAIQGWLVHTPNPGEAVVRQAIVLRLLHAADFDIWNPAEVVPEETDKGGFRPDLRVHRGRSQFILELKGMNVGLHDKDYQQATSYAGSKGIRWAFLTDGRSWVMIDEHLKGQYSERIVLRLEMTPTNLDPFIEDFAQLFEALAAQADDLAPTVEAIEHRRQQRHNEDAIRKMKTPIVTTTQDEFGIATFEKAAAAAVQMGRITEAERDVLLGQAVSPANPTPPAPRQRNRPKPEDAPRQIEKTPSGGIRFTYALKGAEAHAIYDPTKGTWTVLAGSTARAETKAYAEGVRQRRVKGLSEGSLETIAGGLIRYVQDVIYSSPSTAAQDISGASRNGWACWKDHQGELAHKYHPNAQPD